MDFFKMTASKTLSSDKPHRNLCVGAINPHALVEGMLGMEIDRCAQMMEMQPDQGHLKGPQRSMFMVHEQLREKLLSFLTPEKAKIISEAVQCDYDELFDMKYNSILYAGLKLDQKDNVAEPINARDMHNLTESDMITPDLSKIRKVSDLHDIVKDLGETEVKGAVMENGNLRLVLQPPNLGKKLSNYAVTHSVRELATPYRKDKGEWTPPNCDWEDIGEQVQPVSTLNMPVQGAVGNSYLIAALFAVAWSDPYSIVHVKRPISSDREKKEKKLAIKFYSKGGEMDSPTSTVEVNFEVPVNKSSGKTVYCHSSGQGEIWPSLYEKAYAKWVTRTNSEHPDITQTCYGDPVKTMCQIKDATPHYYFNESRSAKELIGLVRENSVGFRTIMPMTAWTHATGKFYKGANIVANMAYTVLGWASPQGSKQYIIVRSPWGVTEQAGLATYPGLLSKVDAEFWSPAHMVDQGGVFALEAEAFKEAFAGIGIAK